MKITEDFIGNETKELTKTKIATILRWWGFNPDSYSTWGNARVDMNNILSGSSSSTISDRERASSFLSKINYINDTDTVISNTLFAANEPGVWYDPSDLSTLYQDSAGTTPVTAVEQPVGLMLDKSKGLVLGVELQTGAYQQIRCTDVDAGNGYRKITKTDNDPYIEFSVPSPAGKTYEITVEAWTDTAEVAAGRVLSLFAYAGGVSEVTNVANVLTTAPKQCRLIKTFSGSAASPATFRLDLEPNAAANGSYFYWRNWSVRELPGNHAFQTTATSRPVLSARYNLLTKTEQFDDAVWSKSNTTVTANAVVAPDGTLTADTLIENTANAAHSIAGSGFAVTSGAAYTYSVYVKAAARTSIRVVYSTYNIWQNLQNPSVRFNLATGVSSTVLGVASHSITPIGNGWFRCSMTSTPVLSGSSAAVFFLEDASQNTVYAGDGTSGIYIWGADLRVANDGANLPPYQRVNTATDYDTAGFPHYLRFDGVDDWLVTNKITPGIDKVQVFAGVRKLSDAAIDVLVELGDTNLSRNGSWVLQPTGITPDNAVFASHGTARTAAQAVFGTAPKSGVLTGIGDISGDKSILRLNGAQIKQNTLDQGTGNYLAYPLYIGRRGGTSFPFNGYLYSLIVRFGSNLPVATIEKLEKYINGLTKAY